MRLFSWNVNGVRAIEKKDSLLGLIVHLQIFFAFKKQKQILINYLNHFKTFTDTMDIGIPELEKGIVELRLSANMNRLMFNMGWELRNMIEKEEY